MELFKRHATGLGYARLVRDYEGVSNQSAARQGYEKRRRFEPELATGARQDAAHHFIGVGPHQFHDSELQDFLDGRDHPEAPQHFCDPDSLFRCVSIAATVVEWTRVEP